MLMCVSKGGMGAGRGAGGGREVEESKTQRASFYISHTGLADKQ